MLGEIKAYLGSPQSQKVTLVTRVNDRFCRDVPKRDIVRTSISSTSDDPKPPLVSL